MREVARHTVGAERLARALDDITGRAYTRWFRMRYDDPSPEKLAELAADLLDHVAAATVEDPGLTGERTRLALRTAAECRMGLVDLGCFPDGDQRIDLPLIGERLSSEDIAFGAVVTSAATARTWLDAFSAAVVSGLVLDWQRVIGLLLRDDFAPAIHEAVPYSEHTSMSEPGDLAAMDALCGYLSESSGHLPGNWPTIPLRKPEDGERAEAARRLDAAGQLSPDHRLLRVLLDDDQPAFEAALAARLTGHRDSVGPDPAPATLLPIDTIAITALAVQTHRWTLTLSSPYLPTALIGSPTPPPAETNTLGGWTAR